MWGVNKSNNHQIKFVGKTGSKQSTGQYEQALIRILYIDEGTIKNVC